MKRITLFITSLISGGAEHQLVNLAGLLVARGYAVDLVTFSKAPDHYATPAGVNRIILGEGRSDKVKMLAIWKYFLTLKNDVVISFGQRENQICLMPLKFNRRPKVIAGERNFSYKPGKTEDRLVRNLYKRANWVVPNSHSQGAYLSAKAEYLASRIKVITNYTDLEKYTVAVPPSNELPRIGVFCSYTPQKNTRRFSEAVKILKDKVGTTFRIDWYGGIMVKGLYESQVYVNFKKHISDFGIGDVLFLHDKIDNVQEVMGECDAICLPSLYEGFSNTLSEAICCGKVCLASRVSDNPVMVEDGVNGFLFDPKDVSDIACSFERFFATGVEQRIAMGKSSRAKAEMLFDADKFIDSYIELIES